jgi:hypothetical protein
LQFLGWSSRKKTRRAFLGDGVPPRLADVQRIVTRLKSLQYSIPALSPSACFA